METTSYKRAVIHRRRGIPHRKWSCYETTHLVNYIRDNDFEKPTGRVYYQKFLHMNHLNIQWTLVRNKTRNLRTSYEKALKWLHSEDALKMPEGLTKRSKIEKMCPHFDVLNEVFCERTNLQKLISSPSNENSLLELEYPVDKFQSYSSEHGSLNDETRDIKIEDITVEEKMITENDFAPQNQPLQNRKASEAFDITVTNDTKHNSCECMKEVVRTMASYINDRNDYQQARLDLERSKFEFEKERITKELEFREKELQQNERLKLLEIESKERILMKELEYKYKAA